MMFFQGLTYWKYFLVKTIQQELNRFLIPTPVLDVTHTLYFWPFFSSRQTKILNFFNHDFSYWEANDKNKKEEKLHAPLTLQ